MSEIKLSLGNGMAEYKVNLAKKKADAESTAEAAEISNAAEAVHDMAAPPPVVKQEDTVMRESVAVEQDKQPAVPAAPVAAPAPVTMGGFTAVNQGRASSLDASKLPSRGS